MGLFKFRASFMFEFRVRVLVKVKVKVMGMVKVKVMGMVKFMGMVMGEEQMRITIEKVQNGFILFSPGEEGETYKNVFQFQNEEELETMRELLYSVMSDLGYVGSKHDDKRLWIVIGDGGWYPTDSK